MAPLTDDDDVMHETRRANFALLLQTGPKAKVSLADALEVSSGHLTLLEQGKRLLLTDTAREMETQLGLPALWFDSPKQPEHIPSGLRGLLIGQLH